MKSLETRTDQDNAILGQNFSSFSGAKFFHLREAGKICFDMPYWAKIFQKGFEKFRRKIVRLPDDYRSPMQRRQRKKSRIPHQHALFHTGTKFFYLGFRISMHCSTLGQNFSIFKKLEKFIHRCTLGQIFPFSSGEKLEKFERVIRNGPCEGVSPDIDRNGPREGVRPKSC